MKNKHLIFCLFVPSLLAAQDNAAPVGDATAPLAPAAAPYNPASPGPAPAIVGSLPGEPAPAPAPPPARDEPRLVVPEGNTVDSRVHDFGDHTVTVERVRPVELPPLPPAPAVAVPDPGKLAALRQMAASRPLRKMLTLSGTVYDRRATFLRWTGKDGRSFEAWSNVDFDLLRGLGAVRRGDSEFYFLYLGIGEIDTVRTAARAAAAGRSYQPPSVPPLPPSPESQPAFVVIRGNPSPDDLAGITALHDLYRLEHLRLKTSREQARLAAERQAAERLANPPKPPDIIIKSWRLSGQATVPGWKGGSR